MRLPEVLSSLAAQGVIDEVVRPLKSGKEAQVYLVVAGGETRVAKVYKDAQQRSFKQRAQYTEGRRVRNTRDQRAIDKRTRYGKAQQEDAWKSAEVDVIYRLHAHGLRVPKPYNFIDGVLIMELVRGEDGYPAPRLSEVALDPDVARSYFDQLLRGVVEMLCAGIVHGDLSEHNVLVSAEGPVIIDFPQAVDASQNRNARQLLLRDVDNLGAFLARCVPRTPRRPYGQEIWAAYESNRLTPDFELTGRVQRSSQTTSLGGLLDEIAFAERDERRRREASGQGARPKREVVVMQAGARDARQQPRRPVGDVAADGREAVSTNARRENGGGAARADVSAGPASQSSPAGSSRRKRRRRRRGGGGAQGTEAGRPQRHDANDEHPKSASGARAESAPAPNAGGSADTPKPRRRRRRRRRGGNTGGASTDGTRRVAE